MAYIRKKFGTIKATCPTCNHIFKSFISDKRKYCSTQCYHKSSTRGIRPRNRIIKECTYCGVNIERPASNFKKGLNPFCNLDCFGKYNTESKRFSGENNYNWNGGYTQEAYKSGWYRLKKDVKERANGVCEICGGTHKLMDIHHKIPVCSNEDISVINNINNLQYLCRPCHIIADKILRGRYPNEKTS